MSNDMGAQQNYQHSLLDAISTVVQQRINGLKLDKTIVGIVDKNIGTLNGCPLYQIKYEGGIFTATARNSSESYAKNTAVYVTVPQSDFSKEKFIVGRASSISADQAKDTAISNAINNYVKLGGNLIDGSTVIGLRSYHDPKEEKEDVDSILHRARFLYNVDPNLTSMVSVSQDAFKVYMQDAKNILLKADFRTLLDATQQRSASGRYGLAVTLTFSNPNAGYGETQGEILDNLGSIIIGSAPKLAVSGKGIDPKTNRSEQNSSGWLSSTENIDNISLKEWDNKLQLFLNSYDVNSSDTDSEEKIIEAWQANGTGLFDCFSQYIQTIYQTFCINNSAAQSAMTDNLVNAYINLLLDLKNAKPNLDSIKNIYNEWKAVSIGDLSDIDEIIYLTSDTMLGNPFSFTSWNTQYTVSSQQYDFSRFKEVKNILFFKEGFQEDSKTEQIWPPSDAPADGGRGWDIFCQNIELFLLKDLDAEYQDLSLKIECANNSDGILKTLLPTEKVTFNAHVFRNYIEELTGNANIEYVWLRQDSQVINASHPDFYHYAGVGWKRLRNTNRYIFQTTGNENWAYKNVYKCIALYQDSTQTIPLSTNFIVYNSAVSTKIKLESDLGTNFTFSEGSPTISCLIQEEPLSGKVGKAAENYQEYGYFDSSAPLYKYHWSIRDIANDSILFLEEATSENNSNILKENVLSKIKMWCFDYLTQELKETDDPTCATRIQYPVSLSSGGFIVECIVQKNFSLDGESTYYNIGNATIDITNLSMVSSSSYRINIENGDQVFQYDVYGNAPTETKFKDPLEIKPLKAKIIGPTGLEFSGENVDIEWIFNLEDTLIVPPENLVLNPATQQEQIVKGSECTFKIEKLYNPNAQNNQITCHAHFNDLDVYADTTFNFSKAGSNGTNGTDVVSTIKFDEEKKDRYFVLHSQPLTLYVQKGCPIEKSEETETKGMLNVPGVGTDLQSTIQLTPDVLDVHLYQKGEEVEKSKFAGGYPKWNLAGNANGITNNTGKYFKIDKDVNYNIVWDPTYRDDKESLLLQTIRSEVSIAESDQTYYSFFSLPIIEYEPDSTLINERLPIQRIAIDKDSYLKDVVYNSDGRNPIYNHNQGLKLINLPENSMVTWEARGGLNATKSDKSNIVTEYFETEPCFSLGFEKDTDKEKAFSKLYTQRTSTSDQAYQKALYEEKREKVRDSYYTIIPNKEDPDKNITIPGPLYQLYLTQYEEEVRKIFIDFKQKKLRELQQKAKEKFWKKCQQTGEWPVRTIEKDDEGNETTIYWTEESIRNGQREDMDYQDYFWFSQHIDLWWNAEEIVSYDSGELYLDENGGEKPVYIWDDSRYQTTTDENQKDELYSTYYKVYYTEIPDNDSNIFQKKEIEKIDKDIVNTINKDNEDYRYKTIYCKVNAALKPEDYFESIYPSKYKKETPLDTEIIEDNSSEAMVYVLPNDTYDGSATNNRIEAKIYILDSKEEQSSSEEGSSEENNTSDNNNNTDTEQPQFKLYATVYAPINMTLDTFGLDSINAWDGNSVTIDEERGAILAPQVGAGEKDSNNRFTGILMGKTNTYTGQSDSENQIGLFGYSYGIQSIFLDAKTGNADFGLPNGSSLQLDSKGNYIGLKNDDYNEGRIELRPGGVSKIGGWRLGHRSFYYTKSGNIGPRYKNDYIPNINTGKIARDSSDPYSKHHEKDIDYRDSGILLHSGDDPYISIKGRELTENDIPISDLGTYLRPKDSLEIQLDPKTPTLFTIFRHNGSNWMKRTWEPNEETGSSKLKETPIYEEGTRTYLAGINGKGEFVANTVSSIVDLGDSKNSSVYSTQFSVNSFGAFNDPIENEKDSVANHTGLRIKVGPHIIGQLFIANNGLNPNGDNATLFLTGGRVINSKEYNAEYSRPIGLYGREIKLFAQGNNVNDKEKISDANLILKKDELTSQVGQSQFNLFNNNEKTSLLETNSNLKINVGLQNKSYTLQEITTENETTKYYWPTEVSTLYVKDDENNYFNLNFVIKKENTKEGPKFEAKLDEYIKYSSTSYIKKDIFETNNCYYLDAKNKGYYWTSATTFDEYYKVTIKDGNNNSEDYYTSVETPRYINESFSTNDNYERSWTEQNQTEDIYTANSTEQNNYVITDKAISADKTQFFNINGKYILISDTTVYIKYYNSKLKENFIKKNGIEFDSEKKYYYINGNMTKTIPNTYYYVQANNNNYQWVLTSKFKSNGKFLDPDIPKVGEYILVSGNPKKITGVLPDKRIENLPIKDYSFFAGSVYKKIITNATSMNFTEYKNDKNGININTTSGPISIHSNNNEFNLTTNSGQVIFAGNDNKLKKEEESVRGLFSAGAGNNGVFLTDNLLNLTSNQKMSLIASNYFELISDNVGSGSAYSQTNPQIVLKAGKYEKNANNAYVTLIMNSSDNGWKEKNSYSDYANFNTAFPLFKIATSERQIGIYPQHYRKGTERLYTENLYITMSQYNTQGLRVQNALLGYPENLGLLVTENARFYGKLKVGAYRATEGAKNYSRDENGRTVSIQAAKDIITDSGNIYALGTNNGKIKANYFYGNGSNISNTANGRGVSSSVPTIGWGKYGSTGTIIVPIVNITNGRPSFTPTKGTITIPSSKDIWNEISSLVDKAITNKVSKEYVVDKLTGNKNTNLQTWIRSNVGLKPNETAADSNHTHALSGQSVSTVTVDGKSVISKITWPTLSGSVG